MQPAFVQSEKQNLADAGPKYIRPGYVWCLENCSLMLEQLMGMNNDNDDNNNTSKIDGDEVGTQAQANPYQRMLLVTEKNVLQVWTPDSIRKIPGTEFTQWTSKRCTFLQEWEEFQCNSISNLTPSHDNDLGDSARATNRNLIDRDFPDEEEEEEEDEEDRYRWQLNSMGRSSPPKPPDEAEDMGDVGGPKILSLHAHNLTTATTRRIQPPAYETLASSTGPHNSQAAIAQKKPTPHHPRPSRNGEEDRTGALSVNTCHNPLKSPVHGHTICDNDNIHTAPHSSAPHDHRQTSPTSEGRQQQTHGQPQPANPYKDTLGNHRTSELSQFASGKQMDGNGSISNNGPRRVSLTQVRARPASASAQSQNQTKQPQNKNWQGDEESRRGNPPAKQHGASQASANLLGSTNSFLSQFSAGAGITQVQPQPLQQHGSIEGSEARGASNPEKPCLTQQDTTPPVKRSKSKHKQRTRKKQNYSMSPLSQSPKDSTPFLLGGTTLLGLSSDEDEGGNENDAGIGLTKLQNPKFQSSGTSIDNETTTKAVEGTIGFGQTSFLASESGMHFMGLSDEDDD